MVIYRKNIDDETSIMKNQPAERRSPPRMATCFLPFQETGTSRDQDGKPAIAASPEQSYSQQENEGTCHN